jgi:hypothetical protein
MKRFVFNNLNIQEVRNQFISDIGQEYELQNGSKVIIEEVMDFQEVQFPNLVHNNGPDFDSKGETNLDNFIGAGTMMYGFQIRVKTPTNERGSYAAWSEWICVPINQKFSYSTVQSSYKDSIIHNK